MKNILSLLLIATTTLLHAQAVTDTIIIRTDSACSNVMPLRMHYGVQSKTGGGYEYNDSIRVCGKIVNGSNRQYHLIVYNEKGIKKLEGDFFDQYANGRVTFFDDKGELYCYRNYKMKGRGKHRRSKSGRVHYYGK